MNRCKPIHFRSKWVFALVLIFVLVKMLPAIGEVKTVDFYSESVNRTMKYNLPLKGISMMVQLNRAILHRLTRVSVILVHTHLTLMIHGLR